MKINPNQFKNRRELDNFIFREHGSDIQKNRQKSARTTDPVVITGKTEELKRLHLSAKNDVWGIKVVDTEQKKEPKKNYQNTKSIR